MSAGQDSVIGRIIATILPPKNDGVIARVIALPPSLQNTSQAQSVDGEVVQQNKDGTLRVQTQQGTLEIAVRGNNVPKAGQTIQIDIPKGDPPRQVVVREAPQPNIPQPPAGHATARHAASANQAAQAAQHQQVPIANPRPDSAGQTPRAAESSAPRPASPASPPSQPSAPPASAPASRAPLPEQVLSLLRTVTSSSPQQALQPGQSVRLTQVTPLQAQQILQQPQSAPVQLLETRLPQSLITRTSFEANLIAQNVQSSNLQQLVQTPRNSTEQLVRLITGQQAQAAPTQTSLQPVSSPPPASHIVPFTQLVTVPQPGTQPIQNIVTQLITLQASQAFQTPALALTLNAPAITPVQQAVSATVPLPSLTISTAPVTVQPGAPNPALTIPVQALPATPLQHFVTQTSLQNFVIPTVPQTPSSLPTQAAPQNALIASIQSPAPHITVPAQTNTQAFTALLNQVQSQAFLITQGSPQNIPAIVAGTTPQNLPLVIIRPPATALPQSFILQAPAPNLQPGTQILLRPQTVSILTQPTLPQAAGTQLSAQPLPLPQLLQPGPWPIMDELYQGLLRVTPQAAQSLSQSVPNPASNVSQLTPAALLFVAAVRSGDFASWLGGKSIDALQRIGKGNLPGRLGTEMASLNRGDAPVGEWRAVPLPMFWEGEIQKVTLYTRQDRDANGGEDGDPNQTRFVFDLDLTRMGPVQLDGLIKGQRLDLIVRTEIPFSEPMRQAMRQAYTDALYSTELSGELNFQGDTKHWVNVLQRDSGYGASA